MSQVTVWDAILSDPSVPFDRATLGLVIADQRSPTRRWLYPVLRPVSRVLVGLVQVLRAALPVPWTAHSTMDRLCVWFLRRFVSPDAVTLLMRHFLVETNLLTFLVRNHVGCRSVEPNLRPVRLAELGNHAVIEHDLNVYRVLTGLGPVGAGQPLDYSMLCVPATDPEPHRRRLLRLDIQSALCLMNIPFAVCLSRAEYRRAVHSMRLDSSLMHLLADLTGDATFRRWAPGATVLRVDSVADVPRMVYEHAVICEHAHERLRQLARGATPLA